MSPGRELDALVAEKVMGFATLAGNIFVYDKAYKKGDLATAVSKPIPNYSTDIAAAWDVVEKVSMSIFPPSVQIDPGRYNGSFWMAQITGDESNNYGPVVVQFGSSAPHVICLAALKAVGVSFD